MSRLGACTQVPDGWVFAYSIRNMNKGLVARFHLVEIAGGSEVGRLAGRGVWGNGLRLHRGKWVSVEAAILGREARSYVVWLLRSRPRLSSGQRSMV